MSRIDRVGTVNFGDACISIWEEGLGATRAQGGYAAEKAWERTFKRDVFARIVQTLNRLGWACAMPAIRPLDIKHYGDDVARWSAESKRECSKGDLKGHLDISGRCIKFEMWQDVTPSKNSNGGRYDFDKEPRMPYLLRVEMERTRRRIRDYLCNVFTDYAFEESKPKLGFNGVTAIEYAARDRRDSCHYVPELDRARISNSDDDRSADGFQLENGTPVYAIKRDGRVISGIAFYSLNGNWQIVTGRYDLDYVWHNQVYVKSPGNVRMKRNADRRRKRLEDEMARAVKAMRFERAAQLRDILFPGDQALFNVWHEDHQLYHRAGFCGYTADQSQAGKFTLDEVRGWDCAPNRVVPIAQERIAA
jgi:hypothetical protein